MNSFNRDYALVAENGFILAESHNPERLKAYRSEFIEEGCKCEVIKSDFASDRLRSNQG